MSATVRNQLMIVRRVVKEVGHVLSPVCGNIQHSVQWALCGQTAVPHQELSAV